jgi:hypothetical protein
MSKPTKFTKGPWVMCHRGESLKGAAGQYVVIWGGGLAYGTRTDEADANSALIAAAPEMYAALNRFYLSLLKVDSDSGETKALEQLLAKARGE